MRVAHTGQLGSSTQPARRLRRPVPGTGGESTIGFHHNRHDVNEVGRLGAQSMLVDYAVRLCVWAGCARRAGLQGYCRVGWRVGG